MLMGHLSPRRVGPAFSSKSSSRASPASRGQSDPRDATLRRHRWFDGSRQPARRCAMAQAPRGVPNRGAERDRPLRGPRDRCGGRWPFVRFESPARAIECTRALRTAVKGAGIEVRAGIPYGRMRAAGAGAQRDRRPHRGKGWKRGGFRRNPRVLHGPGRRRRVGPAVREPRRTQPERCSWSVASLRTRGV